MTAFSISLLINEDLSNFEIKEWYDCVCRNSPTGIIGNINSDDNGKPKTAKLIKRKNKNVFEYIIPLTRKLLDKEAEKIVVAYAKKKMNKDFDIEVSQHIETKKKKIQFNKNKFNDFCNDLAKREHNDWLASRQNQGWSYGISVDERNKTHPLMVPWENLPEKFKKTDMKKVKLFFNFLNEQGYSIVSTDELNQLKNALRKLNQ